MNNLEVLDMMMYFASNDNVTPSSEVSVSVKDTITDVFCITVPGSAFVMRRGNKISVTGNCHVSFMSYLVKDIFDLTNDRDKQILTDTLMEATEEEISWGKDVYGDRILGISEHSTESNVKYLANQRAKVIGLGVLYKGFNENPYAHLKQEKKENFFETSVTEYSQSTAVSGWDTF